MTLQDNWQILANMFSSTDPPNKSARRHVTCWRLSCLCWVRVSKDPSLPCHWPKQWHLRQRLPRQWSAWFAPRCGALGSVAWAGPARLAAGQSFPVAFCGSAGGEAGRGAPRWLPAPRGWPGSGGCFCSTSIKDTDGAWETDYFISGNIYQEMLFCSCRCAKKHHQEKKSDLKVSAYDAYEYQYINIIGVLWSVLTKLRSNFQVNKMVVFFSPQVPHFVSADLQESSAALPHLHSHFHCLKNIPLSHFDPVAGWGGQCRVTVETVSTS